MCGINGIFGLEDIKGPKDVVEKMNRTLAHRGPNAKGIYSGNNIVLGHQRLSIIDLDESANQPMLSNDGRYCIVYNGEVYNFKELRSQLSNYQFKTDSDTEVVIAAFEKWGVHALEKFNGMFALALWDTELDELWLARDRMGIKPLYYAELGNSIVFSSEVRALLSTDLIEKKMDHESLIDYLRYATVHAPKTILKGVKLLEPGNFLKISDVEIEKDKFYKFQPSYSNILGSYSDIKKTIRSKLEQSVQRRLISDVPHGAFLSGGIDSSAIVGLMSQVSDQKVNTFSVVFDENKFDESEYSQLVAKKFDTNHTEIRLAVNDFKDKLPEALEAMDHPSGDGPNSYLISKKTKENGITVALSGLGGDELFAGYDLFTYCASLSNKKWITSFPKFIRQMAGGVYSGMKKDVASSKVENLLSRDYFDLEYIYPTMRTVLFDDQILGLLNKDKLPINQVFKMGEEILAPRSEAFKFPYLSKISLLEFSSYMSNVLLRDTDQMSMASALEVRVPFLDHELIEYVLNIPDTYKYPSTPKKILTESLSDLLPEKIVNRPKMGFTLPWQQWMKNDLMQFCEDRLNKLKMREPFNGKGIENLWQRFLSNDTLVTWSRIWPLVVLEHWMTKHQIES